MLGARWAGYRVPEWVTVCAGQGNGGPSLHCAYRLQVRRGDCPRETGAESKEQQAQNPVVHAQRLSLQSPATRVAPRAEKDKSPQETAVFLPLQRAFPEAVCSWSEREAGLKEAASQHP